MKKHKKEYNEIVKALDAKTRNDYNKKSSNETKVRLFICRGKKVSYQSFKCKTMVKKSHWNLQRDVMKKVLSNDLSEG